MTICSAQTDPIQSTKADSTGLAKNTSVQKIKSSFVKWEHVIPLMIGILLGYVGRQTEFKKYLLQKRIDSYSDFLKEAEICRRDALSSILAAQLQKNEFDHNSHNDLPMTVTKIFWPLITKKYSVKLVLDVKYQNEFEEIIRKLTSLTIHDHVADTEDLKIQEIEALFARIEVIFINSINRTKSFIPRA